MATALHTNSTAPGNGVVASTTPGQHTISMTIAGVGAIEALVQVWCKSEGSSSGTVDGVITISGTTTKASTYSFNADATEVWLQLISISKGASLSASVETNPAAALNPTVGGLVGFLGFLTQAELALVDKETLARGKAYALVADKGLAMLSTDGTTWLYALTSALPE